MKFCDALKDFKEGYKITLPLLDGYLQKDIDGSANFYGRNGVKTIIKDRDISYIMQSIFKESEEWSLYSNPNMVLDFKEALKLLKSGKRIARKGWNGEYFLSSIDNGSGYTFFETSLIDNSCKEWSLKFKDLIQKDWFIYDENDMNDGKSICPKPCGDIIKNLEQCGEVLISYTMTIKKVDDEHIKIMRKGADEITITYKELIEILNNIPLDDFDIAFEILSKKYPYPFI